MVEPGTRSKEARIAALDPVHQLAIQRFEQKLSSAVESEQLNQIQCDVVHEHIIRLGERGRNAANTGNLQDLFCYTLEDTKNPIRAYAQVLADSIKVVPLDDDAKLFPKIRALDSGQVFATAADLEKLNPADKMLVAHTMVAYGDAEMTDSAKKFIRATLPEASTTDVEKEFAKMVVQSQHGPSSAFVLARARNYGIVLEELYERAGYDSYTIDEANKFYTACAQFNPQWVMPFLGGLIPDSKEWSDWRYEYLNRRQNLPSELIYQLSSDTLTNFLDGTMQSGKWTDASIMFGGVTSADEIPAALAKIVNQYIAEHVALHDRPAEELLEAVEKPLRPWGVEFSAGRAVAMSPSSVANRIELQNQFDIAWQQHNRT